jgi:hypothetical protein
MGSEFLLADEPLKEPSHCCEHESKVSTEMAKSIKTIFFFGQWASKNGTFFIAIGLGAASLIWMCYCFASLYLLTGGALGKFSASAILLVSACCGVTLSLAIERNKRILVALFVLLIPIVSGIIVGLLFDTSIDGQEYHFQAIYALASGWNHYYEPFKLPADLKGFYETLWTTHYPRASWLVSAVEVATGIPLEAAKGTNLSLIIASAGLTAGVMLRLGLRPLLAVSLGLIAAANPVALGQVFTNMNDGVLASCLLVFLALSILWILFQDRLALLSLAPLMAFVANLKFSAVPLLAAFAAAVCAVQWFQNRKLLAKTFMHLLIFGIIAVVGFGFSPYVQNALRYGHPFYPVMGQTNVDIMAANTPSAFLGQSGVKNFVISLFGKTDSGYVGSPQLKIPFTLTGLEIRASGGPDVRVAGFGPLFSSAMVLSAFAILFLLLQGEWPIATRASFAVGAYLLLLGCAFPQGWWARYVPFVWLVPVLFSFGASFGSGKAVKLISVLIATTLGANAALAFAAGCWLAWKRDRAAQLQIRALSDRSTPICVYFGLAQSRVIHLRAHQIHVNILPGPPPGGTCVADEIASYGPDRNGGAICSCRLE